MYDIYFWLERQLQKKEERQRETVHPHRLTRARPICPGNRNLPRSPHRGRALVTCVLAPRSISSTKPAPPWDTSITVRGLTYHTPGHWPLNTCLLLSTLHEPVEAPCISHSASPQQPHRAVQALLLGTPQNGHSQCFPPGFYFFPNNSASLLMIHMVSCIPCNETAKTAHLLLQLH